MPVTPYRVRAVATLLVIAMFILPVPVALANGMPSLTLWLESEYETAEHPALEGVQLVSCDDPKCEKPTLLHEYGTCDADGCLDSSPALSAVQPLECLAGRCVVVFYNIGYPARPPYMVIAAFSDRVRESMQFTDQLPEWGTVVWNVAVHDDSLAVAPLIGGIRDPSHPYFTGFFQTFALTLVVELLVAALALRVWLKLKGRSLLTGLGYVLLANIISYPVTWIVWPALGRFQPLAMRQVSIFIVLGAIVSTALLWVLSRKQGKARRRWLILTLVLLPLAVFATLLCLLLTAIGRAYGGDSFAVSGLPSSLTTACSEAFAISFEALLLYLLARNTLALSAKQAVVISLLMNLSSFLGGLVLGNWL